MQIANCLVSLGGDSGNTVPKFAVTAAEIAVLRAIHGDDAINDIEPLGEIERSNRGERQRLAFTYGGAKVPNTQTPIVESMFPGVAARVFERLDELDLDASFFKATGRLTAKSIAIPIAPVAASDEPTPERLAAAQNAEAAAAAAASLAPADQPAADEDEADDGVGEDINDEFAETPNVLG